MKTLSANDVGTTGGHMGGILIPKGDGEMLDFLPRLDATVINPSAWMSCETDDGSALRLRFVYYNNRLHTHGGTRNEYRITFLTKFLRKAGAKKNDVFEISKDDTSEIYRVRVRSGHPLQQPIADEDAPPRIRLRTSWHRC